MREQNGFTLLELLIGLAITGIILAVTTSLFTTTLFSSTDINSRNDLISEVQLAQQVIAGRTNDAIYVYPVGSVLTLNTSGASTLNTLITPSSQTWKVGTQPFLAMILPPSVPTADCQGATPSTGIVTAGCYRFFAYYPMLRSALLSSTLVDVPKADANNASQWVIMEYRQNMFSGGVAWSPGAVLSSDSVKTLSSAPTYYMGGVGRILADYIQPSLANVKFDVAAPAGITPGRVSITLTGQRFRVASTQSSLIGPQTVNVYPRNWNP
ncbi:prepilin-type N-terminal cleavage/methylation domain-containing protein [Deinococcus psychrotolerans]|uniref:Prepilin-type N-terminal cleavage/methylation domain-containing protein n=1 Tax=Deinococcus psychrotolerans TaxID=2489213 RepID=A0A3G8YMF9_9DEIO|nr:prepilin-type N-terminal cleavage/methylation domain-containing protein [Deinococcus psychrotolerans]AZI42336.1 prepilin-type N-terminal cleavage/methylation domain-containing protein [Deinococcus psychrotolerans]